MFLPPPHCTDLQHCSALPLTLSLSVSPSSARPQLCTAASVKLLGRATSPSSDRKGRARVAARVPAHIDVMYQEWNDPNLIFKYIID